MDGQSIAAAELTTLLNEVRCCVEMASGVASAPRVPYTFFEVATAVGFLHFVRRRVETAVLEVGLGGRLDSTNVCEPVAALITSISFDHTAILGDRLASIATEKAGIIKPGRPVLSGATVAEARAVIERICRERRAPLRQLGVDFHYLCTPGRVSATYTRRSRVSVATERRRWPELEVNLLGDHQAANAAVAVACVEQLRAEGWHLPDAAVAAGLAEVCWPARLEVVGHKPLIVLDCAHNVASALALVQDAAGIVPAGALPARLRRQQRQGPGRHVPRVIAALQPRFPDALHGQPAACLPSSWRNCSATAAICRRRSVPPLRRLTVRPAPPPVPTM